MRGSGVKLNGLLQGVGVRTTGREKWLEFLQERETCICGGSVNSLRPGVAGRSASLNTLLSCGNDVIYEAVGQLCVAWGCPVFNCEEAC